MECAKVQKGAVRYMEWSTPVVQHPLFRFFSNLVGEEGPRIAAVALKRCQCLFSKDVISTFNILSISAMSFFAVPNSPFAMQPKSPANSIWVSSSQTEP